MQSPDSHAAGTNVQQNKIRELEAEVGKLLSQMQGLRADRKATGESMCHPCGVAAYTLLIV